MAQNVLKKKIGQLRYNDYAKSCVLKPLPNTIHIHLCWLSVLIEFAYVEAAFGVNHGSFEPTVITFSVKLADITSLEGNLKCVSHLAATLAVSHLVILSDF